MSNLSKKFLRENNASKDVFVELMDYYRGLLVLLEQAIDIINMQPINEMLVRHGEKRIFEATVSVLGELLKDTKAYQQNLINYQRDELYTKGPFHNFMALENLPKYRNIMVMGYEFCMNERKTYDKMKIELPF